MKKPNYAEFLEGALDEVIKGLMTEQQEGLLRGKITPDLHELHKQHREEIRMFEREMQLEVERLELKAERKIKEMFRPQEIELEKRRQELWNMTYQELKLDPDGRYSLTRDGSVYQKDKPETKPRF